jgi:DNA helicase-2/ATP-dependent DNA helicase PcrA
MTRAKDHLHVITPQRFFVHGQHSQGDRHVYAARTRFIPATLLQFFETAAWPVVAPMSDAERQHRQQVRIDVTAKMRGMWR